MQVMPLEPRLGYSSAGQTRRARRAGRAGRAGRIAVKLLEVVSGPLVISAIGTVCFWAAGDALAGEIGRPQSTSRSTRMDLPRGLDELDLPRYRLRQTNRGWEIRTRHFVIFSTTGREDAAWAAEQLELVWGEVAALADQWSDLHRQEAFGVGAVGVLLTDGQRRSRGGPAAGPRETNFGATIFISVDDRSGPIGQRLPQLRREAVAAFLRVTQQDHAFPGWVQAGLAAYFSGEEPTAEGIRTLQSPEMGSSASTAIWALRTSSDRIAAGGVDRVKSALWVQYLLEGDDGRHAPQFFDALARTLASAPAEPYLPDGRSASEGGAALSAQVDRSHLERLTDDLTVTQSITAWLADRQLGQPVTRPKPLEMTLDERHDRMILILKLARRFASSPSRAIRPKVTEFTDSRAVTQVSAPPKETPVTPIALYRKLAGLPRWATIDTDGTLLISDDRQRLAEVFALSDQNTRYRTFRSEGHTVLEAEYLDSGETFQAWLEEDPDNPKRPIAHLRQTRRASAEMPMETSVKDPAYEARDSKR